nr:probable N-acetyl-gamma-glutamyl-phosphate reductase, chloroplastic isoform X1 [Tanacetum cinerariifolium]
MQEAVYGLTEIFRNKIQSARLVANPGCYPTTILLPLFPLLKKGAYLAENRFWWLTQALQEAVYGLTEIFRNKIQSARLVANPGCYPTTILLPLFPLLK